MKTNLSALRKTKNLTQEQLANAIDTPLEYVKELEKDTDDIQIIGLIELRKICTVLECTAKDLIISEKYEYDENGFLIVDEMYREPALAYKYVVRINDEWFVIKRTPHFYSDTVSLKTIQLSPIKRAASLTAREYKLSDYDYNMFGCVSRSGYHVKLLRAITKEELEEIKNEYKLTDDDISEPFTDTIGALLGSYAKRFTAIQIRVEEFEAIPLERKLREKGIEASNINVGRLNIRIE